MSNTIVFSSRQLFQVFVLHVWIAEKKKDWSNKQEKDVSVANILFVHSHVQVSLLKVCRQVLVIPLHSRLLRLFEMILNTHLHGGKSAATEINLIHGNIKDRLGLVKTCWNCIRYGFKYFPGHLWIMFPCDAVCLLACVRPG